MKNGIKVISITVLAWSLVQLPARAAGEESLTNLTDRASYGVGVYFGNQIKRGNFELNLDVVMSAMKDVLEGREPKLNDQQSREAIMAYQQFRQKELAETNVKEGEAFFAANKNKPGVKTHTVTLADGKTAEFQYKVITEGTGEMPKSNEVVKVNYRGTLINGKEFDSSYKRGQPATFPLAGVIRGWSEALKLMKVGSKWEIYIPSELAYGDRGNPGIEPGSTLIFEVELMGIESPKPPPSAQPTTSDIIKVPSAEEMKAGAKIEVIKAEDLEKKAAEQAKASKTNQATGK
jgi:FKBP-type peptidyl-prolyl cis-trans isomerase FklB